MLISGSIPNLFNGVSQQSAPLRHASQCEAQVNAYSTIADGVSKRPPTYHVAKLNAVDHSASKVHVINRDAVERYVVLISNGDLFVYDLAGTAKTVNFPDGKTYLSTATPRSSITAVTIADYTFIANSEKTVAMLPDRSGKVLATSTISSLVQAAGTATCTTAAPHGDATLDWVYITGCAVAAYNGWHQITVTGPSTFTFPIDAGTASPAGGTPTMSDVREGSPGVTVQAFTNLPAPTGNNDVDKVAGTPETGFDDYYVRDDSATSLYYETTAPGSLYKFDTATMPHILVRNIDGTFTFKKAEWADRLVGDDDSNPLPSFVGKGIRDIFFYRNRLGVISGEAFTCSRSGDYFNFWIGSVTTTLDTDPVDAEVIGTKVSNLRYALPFNKALMLFSEQSQFQVTGEGAFAQRTAKSDIVTEFVTSPQCRPLGLNTSLYFAQEKGGYAGVREYYVDDDTISNDAADTTAHVPQYLPSDVHYLTACGAEDALIAHNSSSDLWIYKFFWGEKEKLQSSWSKWSFDAADTLLHTEFIDTTLWLVVKRSDGTYLDKLFLEPRRLDTSLHYQVMLDRRVSVTGVWDPGNGWTTWTLPYPDDAAMEVVLGPAWGVQHGAVMNGTDGVGAMMRPSSTTVRFYGQWDAGPCYIGRVYSMSYTLSPIYVRDNNIAIDGRLQVKDLTVRYSGTGDFSVDVTPRGRSGYSYNLGIQTSGPYGQPTWGIQALASGEFKVPVMTRNIDATITLTSTRHMPCNIHSIEWRGEFVSYGQRVT